jgi:molecular chaperone GrpE
MGEEEQNVEPVESEQPSSQDAPLASSEDVDPVAALRVQLEEARRLADTFKDQLLRKAAEFENYKRRVESEIAAIMRSANEGLLLALLPVVDDFARSVKAGKEQKDYEAFYAGVEMIHTKFLKVLEKYGVVPFTSAGKPFDVGFHDALLQIPRADLDPHTVVEEVERGYMLFDRVLRHAKVIVSTAPEAPEESNGQA